MSAGIYEDNSLFSVVTYIFSLCYASFIFCSLSLGMWAPSAVHQLLSVVSLKQASAFLDARAADISDLVAHSEAAFCQAGVQGSTSILAACGPDMELQGAFIQGLYAKLSHCAYLGALGEAIGFDVLLSYFGVDKGRVAADILADDHDSSSSVALQQYVLALPGLLSATLAHAWQQRGPNYSVVVCNLMHRAMEDGGKSAGARTASLFFCSTIAPSNDWARVAEVLDAVAAEIRSSPLLMEESRLSEVAIQIYQHGSVPGEDAGVLRAAAACLPVPRSLGAHALQAALGPAAKAPLGPGSLVWYHHNTGKWEAAEIVTVDVSITPPSYGIKLTTGIRETERSRLQERQQGETIPPAGASDAEGSDTLLHSTAEVEALLSLWRALMTPRLECTVPELGPGAFLKSVVYYGWKDLSERDWRAVLAFTEDALKTLAEAVASLAISLGSTISEEGEKLAGAPLGGVAGGLSFFRRLVRKDVLRLSEKVRSGLHMVAPLLYRV